MAARRTGVLDNMTHSLANFDAAPYGVYRWVGEVPPGVPQPDNGPAAMGRGQWPLGGAAPH